MRWNRGSSGAGSLWANSPWSVPRLRGRGDQGGHRDAETPVRQGSILVKSVSSHTQERS
jgi:hypothetical protein